MGDLINEVLMALSTGGIGGFFGWFFTRRKNKAEAVTNEIENGDKIIDRYKNALDDLDVRYNEKYMHLKEMSDNISSLFEKKEQILLQEIEYHKKQAALYKKMYDDKVREFNKYKKEHP